MFHSSYVGGWRERRRRTKQRLSSVSNRRQWEFYWSPKSLPHPSKSPTMARKGLCPCPPDSKRTTLCPKLQTPLLTSGDNAESSLHCVPTFLHLYNNVDTAAPKIYMLMQKLPCCSKECLETLFLTFQGLPVRWDQTSTYHRIQTNPSCFPPEGHIT